MDDMNMPKVDTYGTQQPIAFLKLLVDKGGMYGRGCVPLPLPSPLLVPLPQPLQILPLLPHVIYESELDNGGCIMHGSGKT